MNCWLRLRRHDLTEPRSEKTWLNFWPEGAYAPDEIPIDVLVQRCRKCEFIKLTPIWRAEALKG